MIEFTLDQQRILLDSSIRKTWEITVIDSNGNTFTIPTDKMVDDSISIMEPLCTADTLEIGACEAAVFSIKLADIESIITDFKDCRLIVSLSASQGDTSVVLDMGPYWVDEVSHPNNTWYYQLTAYDSMIKFDIKAKQWYSSLHFPMTLLEFRSRLAIFAGVSSVPGQTLPLDDLVLHAKCADLDPDITGRQILRAIAEINGCFARMTREGQLRYVRLGTSSCITLSEGGEDNYMSSAKHENWSTPAVDSVIVHSLSNEQGVTYPSTGGFNALTIGDNFLCYDMTDAELARVAQTVYSSIGGITYTAHETPTDGRLWLEPGDMITLDSDGQMITTYILDRTITGFQVMRDTLTARVSDKRKDKNSSVQQQIERIKRDAEDIRATYLRADVAEITYATIENLDAANALITNLQAANVVITGRLTAAEADITSLSADKANITDLNAATARIGTLEGDVATFHQTYTTDITAINGDIQNLTSTTAQISELVAGKADITDLTAATARIGMLESGVAYIDTLMFGSATGTTIQTSFANAVVAQLGNAQIKDAMIDTIAANKITSGSIYTNTVHIYGDNTNKLSIVDNTISISDGTRVRVQIGKDANNDYNMYVWNSSGKLMFDAAGLTANGVTRKVVRDDVVQDNANIAASKLNIDSLFTVINNDNSHTLNGSKIKLDAQNQTLDVAFTSLTSTVTTQGSTISSQGTAISVIQGQITSKIWQQDIDDAADDLEQTMDTQYSALTQSINGVSSEVGAVRSNLANNYTNTTDMIAKINQTAEKITSEATARLEATVGYSSKNLLELSGTSETTSGITWTVDTQAGTITANGTCTAENYETFVVGTVMNTGSNDVKYYLSGCADGGASDKYYLYAIDPTTGNRPKQWDGVTTSLSSYNLSDQVEILIPSGNTRTENLFDINNVLENYYLSNGVPAQFNHGGYVLSDYIPIASNTATISAKITEESRYGAHWAVYDENKTFIRGGVAFVAYDNKAKVMDTSGAAFIRVDYSTESFTDCMLNLGSTALPYEPYGYKTPISTVQILVRNGQTLNNLVFKPMVRDGSISDKTFEPYKSIQTQITDTNSRITQTADSITSEVSKKVRATVGYDDENLIDFSAMTQTSDSGITFTVDSKGVVTANGTATKDAYCNFVLPDSVYGNFYLTGCPDGGRDGSTNKYLVYIKDETTGTSVKKHDGTTASAYLRNENESTEVQLIQGHTNRVRILISNGTTVNNLEFNPCVSKHKKVTTELSETNSRITQTDSQIRLDVSSTYSTKTEATDKANTAQANAISAAATDATTKANKAKNDAIADTDSKLLNYSTTTQMNSAIDQKADSISLEAKARIEATVGYSSKNLFEVTADTQTKNGITFTIDKTAGTIKVNGTATAQTQLSIEFNVPSGDYYFSGCPSGGSSSTYDLYAYDLDYSESGGGRPRKWDGTTASASDYGNTSQEIKIVGGHETVLTIRIQSGVTVSNKIFKPMIRKGTIADATFEPYRSIQTQFDETDTKITETNSKIDITTNGIMLSSAQMAYGKRTKNLIPFVLKENVKDSSVGSTTCKRDGDGYKLTNSPTGNVVFALYTTNANHAFDNAKLPNTKTLPTGKYIISGTGFDADIQYRIQYSTDGSTATKLLYFGEGGDTSEKTFEITDAMTYVRHYIWVKSGKNLGSGVMVKPMIRDANIADSTYTEGIDAGAYMCSAINLTPEKLELDTGKLIINSDNFSLDVNGKCTLGGDSIIQSKNYVANSEGMKIQLSDGTIDSKNFKVSSDGTVTSTGGTFVSSNYAAATGNTKTVGGKLNLTATSSTLMLDTANFKITGSGSVTATDLTLTGGIIKTSTYTAATSSAKTVGAKIDLGVSTSSSSALLLDTANFKITGSGSVTATDLTLTGGTIQSANYDTNAGTGMAINLATGAISTGSSRFSVSCSGFASFTGLSVKNYANSKTLLQLNSSNSYLQSANYIANSAGMKINLADGSIDSKNFKVSSAGVLTATGASIYGGTFTVESSSSSGYADNIIRLNNTYTQSGIQHEYEAQMNCYGVHNHYETSSSGQSTKLTQSSLRADLLTFTESVGSSTKQMHISADSISISTDSSLTSISDTGITTTGITADTISGTSITCTGLYAASSAIVINAPLTFASGNYIKMADKIAMQIYEGALALGVDSLPLRLYGSTIWANHSISTGSDLRIKEDVGLMDRRYLDIIKSLTPTRFKYRNISKDTYHTGFIAQDVLSAMDHVGLKPEELGAFVDIKGDGSEYALRYDEFAALLLLYIKDLESQIQTIKGGV